jgi:hypothetical protein
MSRLSRIDYFVIEKTSAELCRETFHKGGERFVVLYNENGFEHTEGMFKDESDARVCFEQVCKYLEDGWTP